MRKKGTAASRISAKILNIPVILWNLLKLMGYTYYLWRLERELFIEVSRTHEVLTALETTKNDIVRTRKRLAILWYN